MIIFNASKNQINAAANSVKRPCRGIASCCILIIFVPVFANLPASVLAQPSSCPGIHITVLDIKDRTGTLACALFESPAGFPTEYLQSAVSIMTMEIQDTQARCDFLGIPPGTYALVVIHDANRNGKLDTNWLGVPTEGYGFSSNAKSYLSAPSFSDASFNYDGDTMELDISLN